MHEITIVKNLVSILEKEVMKHGVGDVKIVHIEVGELRRLTAEAIKHSFLHTPRGEKLRNAIIDVTILPLRIKCSRCGKESKSIGKEPFCCPACSGCSIRVLSGNEFNIKSIEW